jgi:hypothetical protein
MKFCASVVKKKKGEGEKFVYNCIHINADAAMYYVIIILPILKRVCVYGVMCVLKRLKARI